MALISSIVHVIFISSLISMSFGQETSSQKGVEVLTGSQSTGAIRACGDDLLGFVADMCAGNYFKRGGIRHPHSFMDMMMADEPMNDNNNDFGDDEPIESQEDLVSLIPSSSPQNTRFETKSVKSFLHQRPSNHLLNPSVYRGMTRLIPSFQPHPELVHFHRHVRGIVDDCCHKPCTLTQIKKYCGRRRRRSINDEQP